MAFADSGRGRGRADRGFRAAGLAADANTESPAEFTAGSRREMTDEGRRVLGDRVVAQRHDLCASFPRGGFDLICAHYLHTLFDLDRATVLRSAAHALRSGGRLLVVDHGSAAPWSWNQGPDIGAPIPVRRSVVDRGRNAPLPASAGPSPT